MVRTFTDLELDAYLDGELDESTRVELESELRQDADLIHRLEQMRIAWQLLDHLEPATTTDDFTKTTMTMTAIQTRRGGLSRFARRRWKGLAGTIVALAAGFAFVFVPSYLQSQRRLRDIPVIDNLDLYMQAEDIEFLRQLDDAGLFAQDQEIGEGLDDVL